MSMPPLWCQGLKVLPLYFYLLELWNYNCACTAAGLCILTCSCILLYHVKTETELLDTYVIIFSFVILSSVVCLCVAWNVHVWLGC